ncbi:hypothetical protein ACJJTC_013904 [Scirpophaga incertulas]
MRGARSICYSCYMANPALHAGHSASVYWAESRSDLGLPAVVCLPAVIVADLPGVLRTNFKKTIFKKHHPRSCVQRLTLPRDEGGRGLIDITNLHNQQITNLRKFFLQKAEQSHFHKVIYLLDKHYTPLNLHSTGPQANEHITSKTDKIAAWAHKSLHGRHRLDLQQPHVDMKGSNAWLRRGDLFPETEGFIKLNFSSSYFNNL